MRDPHDNLTFAVLLFGVGAYAAIGSLVVPVLPALMEHLHTSQDTATWLMTGYLLSASVATPILGLAVSAQSQQANALHTPGPAKRRAVARF